MGNLDTEAFLKALRSVYEAALEPELWPDVVNSIADMINAESTHLMVVDAKTGGDVLGFLERQDPAAHAEYLEHYFEHDIRVPRLAAARAGEILRDRDVWTEEERLSSPLYHDYQRVHRLYEITGAPLGVDGHLTWLGFSRNRPSPFEDDAEGIIKLMVPHFRQAVRIALEVGNARMRTDALGQLWSDSGRGVLIVAPDGKVAFSNVEAQSMCQRRLIRLTADKLSFREGGLNKLLAINISALRDGRSPPATAAAGVAAAPDGEQFGVRFMPLAGTTVLSSGPGACLMIVITTLSIQTPLSEMEMAQFSSLFGISPGEQRVLLAAMAGIELADHARQRAVKVDTVRQQMKSVMAKTGCRSQKDLFRMVERFCFLRLR